MSQEIRVLYANNQEEIEIRTIPNTLKALQELVGGYIETISLTGSRVLIVNEEGILRGMLLNRLVRDDNRVMTLYGPIVLARFKGDEFTSCTWSDLDWFRHNSTEV